MPKNMEPDSHTVS